MQQPLASLVLPGVRKIFDNFNVTYPLISPTAESIFVILARQPTNALPDEPAFPGGIAIIHLTTQRDLWHLNDNIRDCIELLETWGHVTSLQMLATNQNNPFIAEVKAELLKHKQLLPKVAKNMSQFEKVNLVASGTDLLVSFNEKRELITKPSDVLQQRTTAATQPTILNGHGSPFHRHSPHNTRMQQPLSPPVPPTVKS